MQGPWKRGSLQQLYTDNVSIYAKLVCSACHGRHLCRLRQDSLSVVNAVAFVVFVVSRLR